MACALVRSRCAPASARRGWGKGRDTVWCNSRTIDTALVLSKQTKKLKNHGIEQLWNFQSNKH